MTDDSSAAPGTVTVRSFGNAQIAYRAGTTDELVLRSQYGSARFFPDDYWPVEDATILDVGAHIGVFSVLAAPHVTTGTVHALEPGIENFALLERNLRLNQSDNVIAHRIALGAINGSVRLYHAPGSVGHSFYLNPGWADVPAEPRDPAAAPQDQYEWVTSRVFADFLADNGIDHVDFMKMNIEGAEYDVLLGAEEKVLRAIGYMHVELHPENDGLAERVIERLREVGFLTSVVWSDAPTVKGWLTARRQ